VLTSYSDCGLVRLYWSYVRAGTHAAHAPVHYVTGSCLPTTYSTLQTKMVFPTVCLQWATYWAATTCFVIVPPAVSRFVLSPYPH
jgi:hypothetical protein